MRTLLAIAGTVLVVLAIAFAPAHALAPVCPDPSDCTAALQDLLDDGNVTVIELAGNVTYVSEPLFLRRSNVTIACEPGSLLLAKRWAFNGTGDSLLTLEQGVSDVSMAYCHLKMWREDYANPAWYRKGEWRMALKFAGARNVVVYHTILEASGGDGIYLGGNCNSNVTLYNVTAKDNYRQGISVICASNLWVVNSVFEGTRGTNPQCGLDIEPDVPSQQVNRAFFINNTFRNNSGCGIAVSVYALTDVVQPFEVVFQDNTVVGTDGYGIILNVPHRHDNATLVFANMSVRDTAKFGLFAMSNNASAAAPTMFLNLTLSNVSYGRADNIATMAVYVDRCENVLFAPAVVHNTNDRLLMYGQGRTDGNRTITGVIESFAPTKRGCTVEGEFAVKVDCTTGSNASVAALELPKPPVRSPHRK